LYLPLPVLDWTGLDCIGLDLDSLYSLKLKLALKLSFHKSFQWHDFSKSFLMGQAEHLHLQKLLFAIFNFFLWTPFCQSH
jgi:hypothetical protein